MAQGFYLKARVLYEEFQKKELHYLNSERKMYNSIVWKKGLNLPLQEYLQKINQREKEAEETYKNILVKMEELDQHTNSLSLKLEKLGILQASVTTSITPNWYQSLDFNTGSNYPIAGTHSLCTKDVISLSAKSISTQTENSSYCKKCDILTNNQPSYLLENLSTSNPHLRINEKTETMKMPNHQSNSVNLLSETQTISQYVEPRCIEHISLPTNGNVAEENLKTKHFEEKNSENRSKSGEFVENKSSSFENQMQIDNESIADNTQCYVFKDNENPSVSQSVAIEKNGQMKAADGDFHKETFVSKSDADSINNEFDFLESDTTNMCMDVKTKMKQDVENIKSLANHADASLETKQSRGPQLHLEDRAVHPSSKLNAADEESEASGSLSGFHSPHISVASDSDSIYEKESPLKASAAYQALVGNTVPLTRTPQKESASESEDEVENALASAVQRNHLKSKPSVKQMQDGTSQQPTSTKLLDKSSKPTSSNRPQAKLSKNTLKALGLDSSSGSEVEIPVNSPKVKQIDEDSDEFGFYD